MHVLMWVVTENCLICMCSRLPCSYLYEVSISRKDMNGRFLENPTKNMTQINCIPCIYGNFYEEIDGAEAEGMRWISAIVEYFIDILWDD